MAGTFKRHKERTICAALIVASIALTSALAYLAGVGFHHLFLS